MHRLLAVEAYVSVNRHFNVTTTRHHSSLITAHVCMYAFCVCPSSPRVHTGIAVNALGHGDPTWLSALTAQAGQLSHTSNLFHTVPQVELAKRLVQNSFADKAFFCNSGTEANEGAIKFARKYARVAAGVDPYDASVRTHHTAAAAQWLLMGLILWLTSLDVRFPSFFLGLLACLLVDTFSHSCCQPAMLTVSAWLVVFLSCTCNPCVTILSLDVYTHTGHRPHRDCVFHQLLSRSHHGCLGPDLQGAVQDTLPASDAGTRPGRVQQPGERSKGVCAVCVCVGERLFFGKHRSRFTASTLHRERNTSRCWTVGKRKRGRGTVYSRNQAGTLTLLYRLPHAHKAMPTQLLLLLLLHPPPIHLLLLPHNRPSRRARLRPYSWSQCRARAAAPPQWQPS